MAKGYSTCLVVVIALVLIFFLYVFRSYKTGSPAVATTEVLTRLDNMQSVRGKVSARMNGGRNDKATTSNKPSSKKGSPSLPSSGDITRVLTFEVFGKVQRVSMRKYAKEAAIKFKIKGWIKNTEAKTVKGVAYGSSRSIQLYKKWLSTKGSPRSIIKNANFEEREVNDQDQIPKTFSIKKVLLANGKQWADR